MSLTWHIVRKDLRRLWAPVAVWCAVVFSGTLWLWLGHLSADAAHPEVLATWLLMRNGFAWVLSWLQLLLAYVLVGGLCLEDPAVGTTAFWMTRPISGVRLLGAKLIAAAIFFIVLPLVLLAPFWMADGFSITDCWHAVAHLVAAQAILVGLCFGASALTRNAGEFFLTSLALAFAFFLCVAQFSTQQWWAPATAGVYHTRVILTQFLPAPFLAAVAAHQFLTRNAARSWTAIALGLLAIFTIRIGWPWDFWPEVTAWTEHRISAAPWASKVELSKVHVTSDRRVIATFAGPPPVSSGVVLAAQNAVFSTGQIPGPAIKLVFGRTDTWGDDAARVLAGIGADSRLQWSLQSQQRWAQGGVVSPTAEYNGDVVVAQYAGKLIGTLPFRVGATTGSGGPRIRIVSVREDEQGRRTVLLEERDPAQLPLLPVWDEPPLNVLNVYPVAADVYLLVNGRVQLLPPLALSYRRTLLLNGIAVSATELQFDPPTQDHDGSHQPIGDWQDGAMIYKVHLQRLGFARAPLPPAAVKAFKEALSQ